MPQIHYYDNFGGHNSRSRLLTNAFSHYQAIHTSPLTRPQVAIHIGVATQNDRQSDIVTDIIDTSPARAVFCPPSTEEIPLIPATPATPVTPSPPIAQVVRDEEPPKGTNLCPTCIIL